MKLCILTPEQWAQISTDAHLVMFGKTRDAAMDRVDFTMTLEDEAGPIGYATCREHDAKTLYWQFGGAFPGARGSIRSFRGIQAFTRWACERYDRLVICIENTNVPMLKMALKLGFLVTGVKLTPGALLVEHTLTFKEETQWVR